MNNQLRPEDISVRPLFRVFGAIFLAFIINIYVSESIKLLQADLVTPKICKPSRHRLFCEIDNLALELIPESLQGPVFAVADLAFAYFVLCVLWWLVRPLFKRKQ